VKPGYPHDFRVHVQPEVLEHDSIVARYFEGIFQVTINHLLSVYVVPPFERDPWPPTLPKDIDIVHSPDEARRLIVSMRDYVITGDDARVGTEEVVPQAPLLPGGPPEHAVVFYLSKQELSSLLEEVDAMSERFLGIHDSVPVSQIASTRVGQMLLSRVVTSPNMTLDDRRLAGQVVEEPDV
jgi:hypothetical protein